MKTTAAGALEVTSRRPAMFETLFIALGLALIGIGVVEINGTFKGEL